MSDPIYKSMSIMGLGILLMRTLKIKRTAIDYMKQNE